MRLNVLTAISLISLLPASLIAAPRSVVAQKTELAPVLDGRVDEEQWNPAQVASDFLQQWPVQGGPASERTEVRFLYTEDSLYIGVICYDSEPDRIVDTQSRRDGDLNDSDSVLIILDTYHDGQNGFLFGTNPNGIQYDAQVLNEGVSGGRNSSTGSLGRSATSNALRGNLAAFNLNWNTTWAVQSSRTERGWETEMEIPLKSLRFRDSSEPQRLAVFSNEGFRGGNIPLPLDSASSQIIILVLQIRGFTFVGKNCNRASAFVFLLECGSACHSSLRVRSED